MLFCSYGYSSPIDTTVIQNCPNGFLMKINGKYQCIDSTIKYYPILEQIDEYEQYFYSMLKSINLQILGESKWYNEEIKEDLLRFLLIQQKPGFDSVVLYSFLKQDNSFFKLVKKEMPAFVHSCCFLQDSIYILHYISDLKPDVRFFFTDSIYYLNGRIYNISNSNISLSNRIEEPYIVSFTQKEYDVSKREMQRLVKQLNRLKNCETFERYGYNPAFVIEYFFCGKYYLLNAMDPKNWCRHLPICKQLEKNCPRKSGLKILKWLSKY